MTLLIELEPEVEAKLKERADAEGKPLKEYAESVLERIATRPRLSSYGMLKQLGDTVELFHEERQREKAREQEREMRRENKDWTTS